jgi:hypothetical protein
MKLRFGITSIWRSQTRILPGGWHNYCGHPERGSDFPDDSVKREIQWGNKTGSSRLLTLWIECRNSGHSYASGLEVVCRKLKDYMEVLKALKLRESDHHKTEETG